MASVKNQSTDTTGEWNFEMYYARQALMGRFRQLEHLMLTEVPAAMDKYEQLCARYLGTKYHFPTVSQKNVIIQANTSPDLKAMGDSPPVTLKDVTTQTDTPPDSPPVKLQDVTTQTDTPPDIKAKDDSPSVATQNVTTQTDTPPDLKAMGVSPPLLVTDSSAQTKETKKKSKGCDASVATQNADAQTDTTYYQKTCACSIRDSKIPIPLLGSIPPPKWTPLNILPPIEPLSQVLMREKKQRLRTQSDFELEEALGLLAEISEVLDVPNAMEELLEGLELDDVLPELVDILPELGDVLPEPKEPIAMELPVLLDLQKLPKLPVVNEFLDLAKNPEPIEEPEVHEVLDAPKDLTAIELPVLLDVQELPEVSDDLNEPKAKEELPEVPENHEILDVLQEPKTKEVSEVSEVLDHQEIAQLPEGPIISIVPRFQCEPQDVPKNC